MYGTRIWLPWVLLGLLGPGCARDAGAPQTPDSYDSNALQSLRIPGGQRCLQLLDQLGVKYQRLGPRGRVDTPVEVVGDIAGVRYVTEGRPSLVCDCRLALALHWSAPVLLAWNVSEIEHYGAYVNRTTRQGRPSLHSRGLALDAARFKFSSVSQSVSEDYARGWGPGCWPEAPALNQIVCRLRSLGLFRELITPDHNSDHHDHVHLAIVPL